MYSLASLPKALACNCSELWQRAQRPVKQFPSFLSRTSASAFSTTASLQRGGLGRRVAGAFEPGLCGCHLPCLEGRDLLLAKAGELRGCLCITWVIDQHRTPTNGPWSHQAQGTSFEWNAVLWKNKLFCVSVLGLGWKFLCNTDDNILSFPYPKR